MIPSAPYLRHALTFHLKIGLNVPIGYISSRRKIEVATYLNSSDFVGVVNAFIRSNADGNFFPSAGGVRNYYKVMK